jgi:hypothetical protein
VKTDQLVAMLAQGAGAVDRGAAARRVLLALAVALVPTFVLMQLLYGLRPTLAQDAARWMFWAKAAFVAAIALAGWAATLRLGRPGAALARLRWVLIAPLAAMWLLAAIELLRVADGGRAALVPPRGCAPAAWAHSCTPFTARSWPHRFSACGTSSAC